METQPSEQRKPYEYGVIDPPDCTYLHRAATWEGARERVIGTLDANHVYSVTYPGHPRWNELTAELRALEEGASWKGEGPDGFLYFLGETPKIERPEPEGEPDPATLATPPSTPAPVLEFEQELHE